MESNETAEEALFDPRSLQYLEPTQTSLQCSVCREYFTEPVSAPCGHTFCRACILQALEVNTGCPLCRMTIDPGTLYGVIALSRICEELTVYCPHKSLGCNHTCQRIQLAHHLKDDCIYIGTLCRVEECRKKLLKKDLTEHMESCPYKRVDCLMCNTKIMKSQLLEHHKTCPAESVTCPHCETTQTRIRHLEHIKECPQQIISCTLSEFGCPWKGPRFDLEAIHIPQCPYEAIRGFLELTKAKTDALEQENQHLRGIFHDLKPQVQQLKDQVDQLSESMQLLTQQDFQERQPPIPTAATTALRNFGAPSPFEAGARGVYMEMGYPLYYQHPSRFDMMEAAPYEARNMMDPMIGNEIDMQESMMNRRNNSIEPIENIGPPGVMTPIPASAAEAHELLISENERMRSDIETLTAGLASLEEKQNTTVLSETMRLQVEVATVKTVCHQLRMQMHYLLQEQLQIRGLYHMPPPPPGSPAGVQGAGAAAVAGSKGTTSAGVATGTNGGRPLSTGGPPRSRLLDGLGRQDTKL